MVITSPVWHDRERFYKHPLELYNWEIDACYPNSFIIATGSMGREWRLDMADPEFFARLGELFPERPRGFCVWLCSFWSWVIYRLFG